MVEEAIAALALPTELPDPHPPMLRKRDLYHDPSVFRELDEDVFKACCLFVYGCLSFCVSVYLFVCLSATLRVCLSIAAIPYHNLLDLTPPCVALHHHIFP